MPQYNLKSVSEAFWYEQLQYYNDAVLKSCFTFKKRDGLHPQQCSAWQGSGLFIISRTFLSASKQPGATRTYSFLGHVGDACTNGIDDVCN